MIMFKKILHIQHPAIRRTDQQQEYINCRLLPQPDLSPLSPLFKEITLRLSIPVPATGSTPESPGPKGTYPFQLEISAALKADKESAALTVHPALKEKGRLLEVFSNSEIRDIHETVTNREALPIYTAPGGALSLLAGGYDDAATLQSSIPALQVNLSTTTFYRLHLMEGTLHSQKAMQLNSAPGKWSFLYLLSGRLLICQETIDAHQFIIFEKENEELVLRACKDSQFLWMKIT